MRLPRQALVGWTAVERRVEGEAEVEGVAEIVPTGRVSRAEASWRQAAGGAGYEVAHVGEEG